MEPPIFPPYIRSNIKFMSTNMYYINTVKGKRGPISLAQMRSLAENGCLKSHTSISVGDSQRWIAAGTRQEIFSNKGERPKGAGAWLSGIIPQKSYSADASETDRIDKQIRQLKANEEFIIDTTKNRYYMQGPKSSERINSESSPRSALELLANFSGTLPTNPVGIAELKKLVMQGKLHEDDCVFLMNDANSAAKYVPVHTIPGLFSEIYRPSYGSHLNGEFTLGQLQEAVSKGLFSPEEYLFIGEYGKEKSRRMTRAWKIQELFPQMTNKTYCIRKIDGKDVLFSYKQIQDAVTRGEVTQTTELKLSFREGETRFCRKTNTVMDIEKVVMAWKISGLFQLPANEQRYAVMGNERPSKESFSLSQLKVFAEKGQISKTTFVSDGLASDNYDNIESEHARWFPSVMIHGLFSIAHNDSFYLEQIKGRRVDALGPFSLKQLNTMQGIIHENTKISVWNTQPWLSKEIEVDGPYMGNTQKWVKAKSIPGLENLPLDYAHMRKEPIREIYRKGDALPFYGNPDLSRYDVTEEDVEDIAAELKNGELVPGRGDEYSALRNLKTFYELKFHKIPRF